MAFCNKLGSLMRRTISQSSTSNVSMLNSIRSMSTSKLFVGGLAYSTDDQSLKQAFDSYGDVTEARVITDRDSGRSRGFGFVNFSDSEAANSALSAMDGQALDGRNIRVSLANERPPRSSFGGGGFRGGYGDGAPDF
ncbi:hypothetical protein RJ639_007357 [Escallonia herrerae]|uniref:RRM domain-containing protein n=1 Tax=Escallonia herrerae TaxID=1293975 RepID=A0AA88VXM5_9ASTE|nr:hypothetical protein RJ639_007357 [Escallonia herrerae]